MLEPLLIAALKAQANRDQMTAPYVDTSDPSAAILDGEFNLKEVAQSLESTYTPQVYDSHHHPVTVTLWYDSHTRCGECQQPVVWRHLDDTVMCGGADLVLMACYKDPVCSSCLYPVKLAHVVD